MNIFLIRAVVDHLKDLVQCRESGADVLFALTAFVNTVLSDRCSRDKTATFFGGRLLALYKKSGGIRAGALWCAVV